MARKSNTKNLAGIYKQLSRRERDYILRLWNNEFKTNIGIPLLPFLNLKITYRLVLRNQRIGEMITFFSWKQPPFETPEMRQTLLEKLLRHMRRPNRAIVAVGDELIEIVLAK